MENMKSLADQLRRELAVPPGKKDSGKSAEKKELVRKTGSQKQQSEILAAILEYDTSAHKSMVHVRFEERTVRLMNQFKMATSVDVTRLVAFAVKKLFETNPELKTIIKQFIQNTEL